MKNDKIYIFLGFLSALAHFFMFMFAWNLRMGLEEFFFAFAFCLLVSLLLNLLFMLHILGLYSLRFGRRKNDQPASAGGVARGEAREPRREFTDPKVLGEKFLRHTIAGKSEKSFGDKLLSNLGRETEMMQGIFYAFSEEQQAFQPLSFYAIVDHEAVAAFHPGESIPGEAVLNEEVRVLRNLPEGYRRVASGLGKGHPAFIYFVPFFFEGKCLALAEMAGFTEIPESRMNALHYLMAAGGEKLQQIRQSGDEN